MLWLTLDMLAAQSGIAHSQQAHPTRESTVARNWSHKGSHFSPRTLIVLAQLVRSSRRAQGS